MSKKLVICEKTSQARALAEGLGGNFQFHQVGKKLPPPNAQTGYFSSNDVVITYATGHLLRLKTIEEYLGEPQKPWIMDKLPYFPSRFELLPNNQWAITQLDVIDKLLKDDSIDCVVHFGDPDAEGELLIREILTYLKNTKPVSRLWCNSLVPSVIAEAYFNLENINTHKNLYFKALTRQEIDWLFGINLSRMSVNLTGSLFPMGRVLVPIVKHIYDRDMAIKNFSQKTSYGIDVNVTKDKWKKKISRSTPEIIFDNQEDANTLCSQLNKQKAVVTSVQQSVKRIKPKSLYNLSSFQTDMHHLYGIDIGDALNIAEQMYLSKITSYPRTPSQFLSNKEKPEMELALKKLSKYGYPVTYNDKASVFNDKRCEGGHTALTITSLIPDETKLKSFSPDIQKAYKLILGRTVSNFMEKPELNETIVSFKVGEYEFTMTGHEIIKKGFLDYEKRPIKDKLPEFKEGEELTVNFTVAERVTSPPPKITPPSLLAFLANPYAEELKSVDKINDAVYYDLLKSGATLGTEATTSAIINNAVKYGYIEATKSNYSITEKGIAFIDLLNESGVNLFKDKNIEIAKKITHASNGSIADVQQAVNGVKEELIEIFDNNKGLHITIAVPDREAIGVCPRCGNPVVALNKSYQCSAKCGFFLVKSDKFFASFHKTITPTIARQLLSDTHTAKLTKLKSKNGNLYDLNVTADFSGDYTKYTTAFPTRKNTSTRKRS